MLSADTVPCRDKTCAAGTWNGTHEAVMTRTAYQKWYKMLKPHQKVMQVPGVFGWNQSQCSLKTQTAALLDKLRGFWSWAQEDERVVGMSPWHLNDRSSGMGANMGPG